MKQGLMRKKLRREYLRKKSQAYAVAGVAGLACVAFVFASALLFVVASSLFIFCLLPDSRGREPAISVSSALSLTGPILTASVIFGIIARVLWLHVRRSRQALANLTYVPRITAATLPADEILVRGSEEPPFARSEVLLRAAQTRATPREELLRPGQE